MGGCCKGKETHEEDVLMERNKRIIRCPVCHANRDNEIRMDSKNPLEETMVLKCMSCGFMFEAFYDEVTPCTR